MEYQKLRKVWRLWGIIARVMTNTGSTVRAWGIIYKAVTHSVLLYGS